MILFEWGTYNALSTLRQAALLGTRLTEIPPAIFMKRLNEKYYDNYKKLAEEYFTTITAHGPYYNLGSDLIKGTDKSLRAHLKAVELAKKCGAHIYNYHLGTRNKDEEENYKFHLDVLKQFNEIAPDMVFSLEPSTYPAEFGSFEELERLVTLAKDEGINVTIGMQLENIYLNELKIAEIGDFVEPADPVGWWLKIFEKYRKISDKYLHFRFSQIIGIKGNRRFYKKRVPLGMGFPALEPLIEALSTFFVKMSDNKKYTVLFVYTGLPEVKYWDLLDLYNMLMKSSINKLMNRESQLEHGESYRK